ncbi:MAG: T9SS type A sorting domain-containing protein [Ignavibacteriaceae bacterium]|jgi:hypothetical protein|nr:T9SS type A sorting domain-containing protein [Ignavibacteriaceae bacterium]GIK20715.1 MAG: hypothetical protein BroJett005_01290 [Ignavibacteriota bacterium]
MKKLLLVFFFLSTFIYTQNDVEIRVMDARPTSGQIEWAFDKTILNNEPVGNFSGVQKSDGSIFVAVNDTLSTANLGLVVFTSTDGGDTWNIFPQGINYRGNYSKIKMFRSGLDSIYCSFQIGTSIYVWNPLSGNVGQLFTGNYRTYDMVASSTGNLYVFADSLPNNSIVRYGSITGGKTWMSRGLITNSGAMPRVSMSGTGDTLFLNYYGPVNIDTATSVVRQARYRETAPGILSSAGFIDVITDAGYKKEVKTVSGNGESWIFYTLGPDSSRNIWARKSINNGAAYDPPMLVAGNPNTDEYSFDAVFYPGSGAVDFGIVYYSDSLQVGQGSNATDIIYFKSVSHGSSTFSAPVHVSDNPPEYSQFYSTSIISLQFSGADVAALWVGNDGSKKLFFDKLSAIIPVELTSFTANVVDNSVILNWSTATETNNSGFAVERMQSESNWQEIGFVPGSGTITEIRTYSYTDEGLTSGKYLYRIKQIDYDGSIEYSNVIEAGVKIPDKYSLDQNYPNPFNPSTTINYSISSSGNVELIIFNSIGERIGVLVNEIQQPGRYSVNFDAGNLSSGVYFYKIVSGDFVSVKKMLLLR